MSVDLYVFNELITLNDCIKIPKQYFHSAILSSLRLKKPLVIFKDKKNAINLKELSKKHYHSCDNYLFINFSLKNRIKDSDISENLNTFVILKAYMDKLV